MLLHGWLHSANSREVINLGSVLGLLPWPTFTLSEHSPSLMALNAIYTLVMPVCIISLDSFLELQTMYPMFNLSASCGVQ